MIKKSILSFLILNTFSSIATAEDCPKPGQEPLYADRNGEIHIWCEDGGVKNGPYQVIDFTFGIRLKAEYKNGVLDGPFERRSANGKPNVEGHFTAGEMSGEWRRYHSSGNLRDRGEWRGGKPAGTWESFSPDGQLLDQVQFDQWWSRALRHWMLTTALHSVFQVNGANSQSGLLGFRYCHACENEFSYFLGLDAWAWVLNDREDFAFAGRTSLGALYRPTRLGYEAAVGVTAMSLSSLWPTLSLGLNLPLSRVSPHRIFTRYAHTRVGEDKGSSLHEVLLGVHWNL